MSRTEAELQIAITTKPYAEMSRVSNQRKAEFVSDVFRMRRFRGGRGKILPNTCFIQVDMIC
jgi:hypothetical protein